MTVGETNQSRSAADLIKRDDALAAIDTFKRDFEQSWKVQFSADIKALPAVDPAAIREAALREAADVAQRGSDVLGERMRNAKDKKEKRDWQSMLFAAVDIKHAILALIGEKK